MLVHFLNPQRSDLNEKLEYMLGIHREKTSLRMYKGFHHGLMEILMGLGRQYPMKKQVFYLKGMDPFFEPVAMAMAREGYRVTGLTADDLKNPEGWMQQLGKETLIVLYPEDDPLLGYLHPIQKLEESLADQKVYQLKVVHHAYRYREWPKEMNRFQLELWAISPDLSLAWLGDRARYGDWMAEGLRWSDSALEVISSSRPPKNLNKDKIKNFESQLPEGFKSFYQSDTRLYDRSIFFAEDLDGSAVIEELALRKKWEVAPPGEEGRLETGSLSRWGGLRTMDWLKAYGLTPEQIRGLVIVSEESITPELPSELELVRLALKN